MRPIPPFPLLPVAIARACGELAPPPAEPAGYALPLDTAPLPAGESRLLSDGDTLSFLVRAPENGRQQLVRFDSGNAADSTSVVVDPAITRGRTWIRVEPPAP